MEESERKIKRKVTDENVDKEKSIKKNETRTGSGE